MESQLRAELARIEQMRQALFVRAEELGIEDPYTMRNSDGSYPMMALITARSNVLLAMAVYKADKNRGR